MNSSSKSPGRAERRVGARSPAKGVVFPRKSFETHFTAATRNESAKLTSGWFIPKRISDAEEVMMYMHKTGVNLSDKDYVEGIINGNIVEILFQNQRFLFVCILTTPNPNNPPLRWVRDEKFGKFGHTVCGRATPWRPTTFLVLCDALFDEFDKIGRRNAQEASARIFDACGDESAREAGALGGSKV
jgi:hypothetical protein